MATLQDVKQKLCSIHPGIFEPDDYLAAWFNPAVAQYYVEHAVEIVPTSIRWGQGKPFQCHLNSLTYACEHPGAIPYFGFQYLEWASVGGEEAAASWEVHSIAVEQDGTVIDSGEYVPAATRYVMIPWDWKLHNLIAVGSPATSGALATK